LNTCTAEFVRLSASLRGVRCDANPFITLTNPLSLQNWTLPLIEFVMIAGALAGLVHAVRWYRRTADASNLVIWFGGVVALLLIEPIAYFPQLFGLEDSLGLTFVHAQFTVQFLFDRLPLYIVAMYPMFGYLSYVLVQRTGIFAAYRPLVGACCVAFVFQCFFEVIDTVAPQWSWWVWNTKLSSSTPALGVVPYLNIQSFALVLPFGLTLVTRWVCRNPCGGAKFMVRCVMIVSILVWPLQCLASAPATVVNLLGGPLDTARAVSLWTYIVVTGCVTALAFTGVYRARRTGGQSIDEAVCGDYFPLVCAVGYLLAGVVFWTAGLPAYLDAQSGITSSGAPTGSLAYGIVAFVCSVLLTVWSYAITGLGPARTRSPDSRIHA
jgi:hypothetical protein